MATSTVVLNDKTWLDLTDRQGPEDGDFDPEGDEVEYTPECERCGDGGLVDDDGPNEGCAEFSNSPAYCMCPAGRAAQRYDAEHFSEVNGMGWFGVGPS
jgi:hypothetical protein